MDTANTTPNTRFAASPVRVVKVPSRTACRRSRVRVSLAPFDVSHAEREVYRTRPRRAVRLRGSSEPGSLPGWRTS